MFSRDLERQIIFRHQQGSRVGVQDTLSLKRFALSDREWATLKRRIEVILTSHRSDTDHMKGTIDWFHSLPIKLRKYLCGRLLASDPAFVRQQSTELGDCIDEYAAYRQGKKTSLATDGDVMRDVERLLSLRCSDVTCITESELNAKLDELADELELKPNTLARIAKNWAAFFNWVKDVQHVIGRNPCDSISKVIEPRAKEEIPLDWIETMLAYTSNVEELYWLRLLQWTGCRLGEGLNLKVGDFDCDRSRVTITETKNARFRVNPIYPELATCLPEMLSGREPDERVLVNITRGNCYSWLYQLRARAGVPQWSPPYNAFRSTRANQLAADPSITPVQAGMLLGHSIEVARRNYLSVEDSLLQRLAS